MGLDNYNRLCARSCTCTFHRTVERKCVKQETREKLSVDFYFCPWWKEKRIEATTLNSWFGCWVNALYLFSTQHLSRTHTPVKLGVDSFGRYEKSMHIQLVHPASRNKWVFTVVPVLTSELDDGTQPAASNARDWRTGSMMMILLTRLHA